MSSTDDRGHRLLSDPRLTAMGLLIEAHASVRSLVDSGLDEHGITGSAFEVLIRLGQTPQRRLRMTELAEQSTLSNSGLTRVVDRLFDSGYVERLQDERDRRVFYAVITPLGLEHLLALLPGHLATLDDVLTRALPPDEMDTFIEALRKIRDTARSTADSEERQAS